MRKVVKGRMHRTEVNMDTLQGAPPPGCHSVYGIATPTGPLNYDELVVYDEAAILPYAVVTYTFVKHADAGVGGEEGPEPEPQEEQFVVRKTGELMTMRQLFDAGFHKADCRPVPEAATDGRKSLQGSLAGASAKAEVLGQGLAAIDQVRLFRLDRAGRACIQGIYRTFAMDRCLWSWRATARQWRPPSIRRWGG